MKTWSDGVVESWSVGSLRIRESPQHSSTPNFRFTSSLILWAILGALYSSADAQQTGKIPRIGYLERSTARGNAVLLMAFRQELSQLGYIEGKNIKIEPRFADQKIERLPDLAAELVRLKVDVIVTGGSGPTHSAKQATVTIPIGMAQDPDPVGNGFVASLGRPGGNITGLSGLTNELSTKRLEILKEAVPELSRVGFLLAPGNSITRDLEVKALTPAALALKLKLEEIPLQPDASGLESAFQTAKQKQVDGVMTSSSRSIFGERRLIVELVRKHRLPAIYLQKEFVEEGGLMFYGTDYTDLYRRAAVYVDKILKGAKPADLPVQQATKFEFIINLRSSDRNPCRI